MRTSALIFLMIALFSATAGRTDDSTTIDKLVSKINAAAKVNKSRIMRIVVINTDVAASTLEQEMARTRLTLGDVYVAHSLAMAAHKNFNQIVTLKAGGQSWAEIAKAQNVSLRGSIASIDDLLRQ